MLVEEQLSDDLKVYGIRANKFKFDWSESCIEGDDAIYLDGTVENFSGIHIFNEKDIHIAEGWMEFIYEPILHSGKHVEIKDKVGIPMHIFNQIP